MAAILNFRKNGKAQVLQQNSCFPLGGHYACQCILFLVYNIFSHRINTNIGLVMKKQQLYHPIPSVSVICHLR